MFVDFNKVFSKTPQTELPIPQELADQLSEQLPTGFHYVIDEQNNMLRLSPEANEECSFSGVIPVPTDQQKEILGEDYSAEDIMKLSYNSQQPIPVRLKEDKYVCINGTDVSIDQFSFNPFRPHEVIKSTIYIFPTPFPPAFPVIIGCDSSSIELSVKRIPHNSLSEIAFESDEDKCLKVKYYINQSKNQFSITLNISKEKAKSVKEIVETLDIYSAFVNGKGRIAGALIENPINATNTSKYNEEMLEFWKKVLAIEEKLSIAFDPNASDLTIECIYDIEEIYQSIIKKTPVRHNTNINSITSKWEFKKDKIVEDVLKTPIYFEFDGTKEYELFGQTIVLQCIVGVFNAVITKYEKNEEKDECTIFLEDESDDKKMYTSSLCFINKEEAVKYKEETKDRIQLFMDAQTIQDFLSKE